jgi:hypothetical protein
MRLVQLSVIKCSLLECISIRVLKTLMFYVTDKLLEILSNSVQLHSSCKAIPAPSCYPIVFTPKIVANLESNHQITSLDTPHCL